MKFAKVTRFVADNISIEFHPVSDVPGFTHKVLIVSGGKLVAKDWFASASGRISEKTAAYYYEKHQRKLAT